MTLHPLLDEEKILYRLAAPDRSGALEELVAGLESRHPGANGLGLLDKILKREELGSTAIGRGVAVPHCRADGLAAPALVLGLSQAGIPFGAVDGKPAHVLFLLASPQASPSDSLRILAAVASLTRESRGLAAKLLNAPTRAGVLAALRAEEEKLGAR